MAAHTYSLRNRANSPSISVKKPLNGSISRVSSRSPRKVLPASSIIQLKHVIGTTTTNPSGLTCCELTGSFAYCAGSVAVYATINSEGQVVYRYFKARPTAAAVNVQTSYFDSGSMPSTPTRRSSVLTPRRTLEESQPKTFGREWLDDSNSQTWSARERIKAATCVALSLDGKFLAVGETGYNPRVLVYSTAAGALTDQPLSIVAEHTIGVRCVAFSPDSRFLATLGDVNDGFLHIWSVAAKTGDIRLHSTNKCTTNVCDMTWVGDSLITVGTRHIKIWQISSEEHRVTRKKSRLRLDGDSIASPGPKPLQGRNCLLGRLVDATFTAIAAVSKEEAVVCTEDGYICKLDLSGGGADLSIVDFAKVPLAAVSFRRELHQVIWTGKRGVLQLHDTKWWSCANRGDFALYDADNITLQKHSARHSSLRASLGLGPSKRAKVVAINCLGPHTISIDIDGNIKLLDAKGDPTGNITQHLSSHQDMVRGVQPLDLEGDGGGFLTWAKNGEVRFWSNSGELTRHEQCDVEDIAFEDGVGLNELKIVRYLNQRSLFVTGDRYGVLKLFDKESWSTRQVIRGHSAEVTDLAANETISLLATCGRDRMVQLFELKGDRIELVQTLDEHISAVQRVCFTSTGQRLISCSTDRTIVVRDRMEKRENENTIMAYLSTRIITLKASPLSMASMPSDENTLIVSTMDRHVVHVDVSQGLVLEGFKVGDKDTDDTSILNTICLSTPQHEDERSLVLGFSSIDKSIRVYDLSRGILCGRDWGHTEGISDITLLETRSAENGTTQRTIVSTGLDSTIMLWALSSMCSSTLTPFRELSQEETALSDSECSPVKPSLAALPPLRKVLSKLDMAEFVRQSSPSRESSPHRLKRQTSRLAFSTSIEENEEENSSASSRARSRERDMPNQKKSPSPPTRPVRPSKQRSQTEPAKDQVRSGQHWFRRSPSPSTPLSTPATTPKHQRANNSRLRRPPSVPSELRAQATSQQRRRQSMSNANDLGSIGMASEQVRRVLKTYRKRLQSNQGEIDLEEVYQELEATLQAVIHKRTRIAANKTPTSALHHAPPGLGSPNGEVDKLATLLEKTTV